ncbi:MAG: aminopeptidase P family protein [Deltaproteobacteria bacterium]|nr:aminopeptidase P family protein [Deltaproteobacteria bacterium]
MLLNKDRAVALMQEQHLDALVAVASPNVYYLSDYDAAEPKDVPWTAAAILPRDADTEPALLLPDLELSLFAERPSWMPAQAYHFSFDNESIAVFDTSVDEPLDDLDTKINVLLSDAVTANGSAGSVRAVARALRRMGLANARIGFDDIRFGQLVQETLKNLQPVDATDLLVRIRLVKSAEELTLMRRAATINQGAIEAALATMKIGVSWPEVPRAWRQHLLSHKARPFSMLGGAGAKAAGPLRTSVPYPLAPGIPIAFDAMLTYRGYFGDLQRTCVIGDPSPKLKRYWSAVQAGALATYEKIAPRVSTATLRALAVDIIRQAGHGQFRVAIVHSLGLEHIEIPGAWGGRLHSFTLEPGMIINIDLEVHELGFGAVAFEESMLVTETGAERLVSLPRELLQVG